MNDNVIKTDRRRKAVLIVECDSIKLTRQNLALADDLQQLAKTAFPTNPIHCLKSLTQTALLKEVADLYETGQLYRTIILIGHSNNKGLRISADSFIEWRAVANWISPFLPQRIILLACEAGQSLPRKSLFNGVPSLREIFGSPISVNKNQQYIVMGKVIHVLLAKKENTVISQFMQLANIIITQGIMVSHTREDYERYG